VSAFVMPNRHGIDVDAFDVNAHHVGLFRGDTPMGYARLVTFARGPHAAWIESLRNRYPELAHSRTPVDSPLPIFEYAGNIDETRHWIMRHAADGRSVVEAGRLSLSSEEGPGRLVVFMGNALVSYWMSCGFDIALMACRVSHSRYWESLGFQAAPGTCDAEYNGVAGRVLVMTKSTLKPKAQQVVSPLAREFDRSGRIVYPGGPFDRTHRCTGEAMKASDNLNIGLATAA